MLIAGLFNALVLLNSGMAVSDAEAVVHPNLLINQDEIDRIKLKIQEHEWAARLLEKLKGMAEKGSVRDMALCYAITGDEKYGESARERLVGLAEYYKPRYEKLNLEIEPEYGAWSEWGAHAWAYDLTYNTFPEEKRQMVENWLRTGCKVVIEGEKIRTTTPNLVFGKHFNVALVGYCLGDRELIEWGLNDPGFHGPHRGGFYPVLDSMIKDGYFWGETPIYALHYDVHGMLALAEAALHYDGTDLYHYVSEKSGASIKSVVDGYLLLGYPLERTGIGKGSIRIATYGDGSTSYTPGGRLSETFLVNPVDQSPGVQVLAGELEIAYKRYKDPAYAWLISLNPDRDTYISYGRAALGYTALTHGEILPEELTPPRAPSGIYPSQGFAFLRSDESPEYWSSGGMAALIMLGKLVGHGHNDYYSLILHGKGRLLYPDLNVIQYEPTYLNWTREGIAHSTLLVDHQSPKPGPFTTDHDFNDDVKYFSITGTSFRGVDQSRSLFLTEEYLADFFYAVDAKGDERTYDWVLHGLGRLYAGEPGAYNPTDALVPFYWWVDNELGRKTDSSWRMDWIQRSAGVTKGLQAFGDEWFEKEIGVRMTMLGVNGTQVFYGDGPIADGPPYHRIDGNPEGSSPLVVARRKGNTALFAAIHEPYESKSQIKQIQSIAETDKAIIVKVDGKGFTDYIMTAFDDKEHKFATDEGEFFAFSDYGYLRLSEDHVVARGKINGLRVQGKLSSEDAQFTHQDGFIAFGDTSISEAVTPAKPKEAAIASPYLHYWFSPEEAHLSAAAGSKEIEVHLRCVGDGEVKGKLRLLTPDELSVDINELQVQPLSEGEERIVRIKIATTEKAQDELYQIRFVPEDGLPAAAKRLYVSVGVVMRIDRRIPQNAQFVIRAPGYTMKVDQYSGVSYYLLDADGNRRHGRLHNTNFVFGIPGIIRDEKWAFCFRHPCGFIWEGKNELTVGCAGQYTNQHDLRIRYTFSEDSIKIAVVPPTNPSKTQTMWLGRFDALQPPAGVKPGEAHKDIVGDKFFFPHPVYRQGLLITTSSQANLKFAGSAVNFPVKTGDEVTLKFVSKSQK
jgi:hypothetical protein